MDDCFQEFTFKKNSTKLNNPITVRNYEQNHYQTYTANFFKNRFPVLTSLRKINNSNELGFKKNNRNNTALKKNKTDFFRKKDLSSLIYNILGKKENKLNSLEKIKEGPPIVTINLEDNPSEDLINNKLNIDSCKIKQNQTGKNKKNKYLNYLEELKTKRNKNNKKKLLSRKKNKNNVINDNKKVEKENNLINVNIKINNNNISVNNNNDYKKNLEVSHAINEQINTKKKFKNLNKNKKKYDNYIINKIINKQIISENPPKKIEKEFDNIEIENEIINEQINGIKENKKFNIIEINSNIKYEIDSQNVDKKLEEIKEFKNIAIKNEFSEEIISNKKKLDKKNYEIKHIITNQINSINNSKDEKTMKEFSNLEICNEINENIIIPNNRAYILKNEKNDRNQKPPNLKPLKKMINEYNEDIKNQKIKKSYSLKIDNKEEYSYISSNNSLNKKKIKNEIIRNNKNEFNKKNKDEKEEVIGIKNSEQSNYKNEVSYITNTNGNISEKNNNFKNDNDKLK